jgi:hypothetical protein
MQANPLVSRSSRYQENRIHPSERRQNGHKPTIQGPALPGGSLPGDKLLEPRILARVQPLRFFSQQRFNGEQKVLGASA